MQVRMVVMMDQITLLPEPWSLLYLMVVNKTEVREEMMEISCTQAQNQAQVAGWVNTCKIRLNNENNII